MSVVCRTRCTHRSKFFAFTCSTTESLCQFQPTSHRALLEQGNLIVYETMTTPISRELLVYNENYLLTKRPYHALPEGRVGPQICGGGGKRFMVVFSENLLHIFTKN